MKVQVKEMVKFEDSNAGFPTSGMGVDMDVAYVPVEDIKLAESYVKAGYKQWEVIDIDLNDFTLFEGEYILNEFLEEAKMCAEMEALAPKLSQEEIEHYAKLAEHYDGQLDYEARA